MQVMLRLNDESNLMSQLVKLLSAGRAGVDHEHRRSLAAARVGPVPVGAERPTSGRKKKDFSQRMQSHTRRGDAGTLLYALQ